VQEIIIWVKITFQYSTTNPFFKADDFGSDRTTCKQQWRPSLNFILKHYYFTIWFSFHWMTTDY